jgi:hypothetical protein
MAASSCFLPLIYVESDRRFHAADVFDVLVTPTTSLGAEREGQVILGGGTKLSMLSFGKRPRGDRSVALLFLQ